MKQHPSRLKFKKYHKVNKSFMHLKEVKSVFSKYGSYFIRSLEYGKLCFPEIEACRKSLKRVLKKEGFVILRIFTYISETKKPLASRMGKGKGNHSKWLCPVRRGQTLFEISCLSDTLAERALYGAKTKLSVKTAISKAIF